MFDIWFNRTEGNYELQELVRMFLPGDRFRLLDKDPGMDGTGGSDAKTLRIPDGMTDKNDAKRYLFERLAEATGLRPAWGILTGVRPVKFAGDRLRAGRTMDEVARELQERYFVSAEKAMLVRETLATQEPWREPPAPGLVALYIGIPFCPTRCLYCSFPAYTADRTRIDAYLAALHRELRFAAGHMERLGWRPESVYIGGGTPTTLVAGELRDLLLAVKERFDLGACVEFTVEAGRPDTVDAGKLEAIAAAGADRLSINPQSMQQATLDRIGRAHTPEQVREAFSLARSAGFRRINMDLIAGLPGEGEAVFAESLDAVLALGPENVTVHTLAVKRGSRLAEEDRGYSYRSGEATGRMVAGAYRTLKKEGYRPYYLYRQKQSAGNHENIGYARPGTESVYNIRIMEENQTIVALGAGGASKLWTPAGNRLERVFNVANHEIYVERIEEMLLRKEAGLFYQQEE